MAKFMEYNKIQNFIEEVLENMPSDWLNLTTHRLDIYNVERAKTQFLEEFDNLFHTNNSDPTALSKLPTAYDYIRLGHPLSCVLEWAMAHLNKLQPENIISFTSKTIPVLAILRKNLLEHKKTFIYYKDELPDNFNAEILRRVYGYQFELKKIEQVEEVSVLNGSTILISQQDDFWDIDLSVHTDFLVRMHPHYGSVVFVQGERNESYIPEIQHVRRRETIAMTPSNCHAALQSLIKQPIPNGHRNKIVTNEALVLDSIKEITGSSTRPLLASSGLSIQYAIMMGLVDDALENHPGKDIKFIVPPNCYGGTNDQARRVAECIDNVNIVDLPVDRNNDMVRSIETVLAEIADEDAIPYIIAEIPTNPRVEVPDLIDLKNALSKVRKTATGKNAIAPVFILDQTFCPNVRFLGEGDILSTVKTISYVSGSKFPSGGLCTAGYCVGNEQTASLMEKIERHLRLCDNNATNHQVEILARQLPSMNQRINEAYRNSREFVTFIQNVLPDAKINFVSEELATQGFTPSVFSLDLPTKGSTEDERETHKRKLNHKLINLMISKIPHESIFCVSYGQLLGSYWTIPATSTQGTTKESDKDYIVRISLAPDIDLDLHKKVFLDFVESIGSK